MTRRLINSIAVGANTPARITDRDGNYLPSLEIDDVTGTIYSGDQALAGGGGGVSSFNGRNGAVNPQSGDYSYSLITGTPNFADNESPSGVRPGTSFILAHTPAVGSVKLYRNGIRLAPTTDYTVTGAAITTVQTVQSGDQFLADYRW